MQITYIGHATRAARRSAARVLTDPNFDSSLGHFLPRVSAARHRARRAAVAGRDALTQRACGPPVVRVARTGCRATLPLYAPPVVATGSPTRLRHAVPVAHRRRREHRRHGAPGARRARDAQGSRTASTGGGARRTDLLETDAESVSCRRHRAPPTTTRCGAGAVGARARARRRAAHRSAGRPRWKPGLRRGHLTGEEPSPCSTRCVRAR